MYWSNIFRFLHRFHKTLEKRSKTVKISKRPISMTNVSTHLPTAGKLANVLAGPYCPTAGPILPIALTDDESASLKSTPKAQKNRVATITIMI